MTLQAKQRIAWIDIAKAITIFLVVFGHTIREGNAHTIVYSFHVAAFFLLSGMTCKTDNLKIRIKNDFLRIMVPYYCFGIISILIFMFLGGFAAGELDVNVNTSFARNILILLYACPKGGALKFNMPLWFLPCLFVTKLLYYALDKLCHGKQARILLSSLVLAVIGFIYTRMGGPGLPFNLSVALKMIAYFSLGRAFFLWLPTVNERYLTKSKTITSGILLLVVTGVVSLQVPQVDYASDSFSNIPVFLFTSIAGSFGVCFVSMGFRCKPLEYVGKTTLAILTMHKFPVVLLQTIGPQKALLQQSDAIVGIVSAVIVSIIAIALCLVADLIIRRFCPFLFGDFSAFSRRK